MAVTFTGAGVATAASGASPQAVTTATACAVGDHLVALIAYDNSGGSGADPMTGTISLSPATGAVGASVSAQTGFNDPGAASAGLAVRCVAFPVTTAIPSGTSCNVAWSGTVVVRAVAFMNVSGSTGSGTTYLSNSGATGGNTVNASSSTAIVQSTLVAGQGWLCWACEENGAAIVGDTDTTAGTWSAVYGTFTGTGVAGMAAYFQSKVLTASSAQNFVTTSGATLSDWICGYLVFYENPTLTQAAYRFYDDGPEDTSTALAAQDTALAISAGGSDLNHQLRIRVQATTAVAAQVTDDWQLQWEKNASGTWTNVTTGGTTVVAYNSANLTDAAFIVSARLTGGTGGMAGGEVSETGLVTDRGIGPSTNAELLYSLTLKAADVVAGDTLRFRVLRNGVTTRMTYTQTPTITISGGTTDWPATISTSWGGWTATAVGLEDHVATVTSSWGATTHTASGKVEVTATISTGWGAWTATAVGTVSAGVINWPGTITTGWGSLTATAVAIVEHPATVATGWGAWTATAVAIVDIRATTAAAWGGWTATAVATFEHPATIATGWGGLTATAVGTVTTGPVNYLGTITTGWGPWVATASPAVVEHPATALGSWGVLAASGVAVVAHPATITTGWGGLTATAVAVVDHPATISSIGPGWYSQATATQEGFEFGFIDSNWGELTATATAQPFNRTATVSSNWGQLTATATATTNHPATITTGWGALTTPATGTVSRRALATGSWSLRVADSSADVDRHATITTTWGWTATAIGAPSKVASSTTTWGPATAVASAGVDRRASTSSTTTWTATAVAGGAHYATSTTTWGPFTALATSTVTEYATITTNWGTWDARAYQEGVLAARIDSTWGPLTATAIGVHLGVWGQWNGHAVTDIMWGSDDASDYLMLV